MPPTDATGLDGSDPGTFGAGRGQLAPSSMGAPDTMRAALSEAAIDGSARYDDMDGAPPASLDDKMALDLLRDASSQSRNYFEQHVHGPWQRSYRALRNEHFEGSLYLKDEYRARSKIFKPKTRSMLRKRLASTARAMFSPGDVVSVEAEDESSQQQVAAAALKQEMLNYRLRNTSHRNGIPWFLTATGARFDAEVTSICCSKQFWNYQERETGEMEVVHGVDPETGQPTATLQRKMEALVDKPDIMLIPPENVRFDPNANWTNVAQLSSYVLLQFPMTAGEAWEMIQQNKSARVPWKSDVTYEMLTTKAGGSTPSETTAPRSTRAGGVDPTQQASGKFRTVWLTEVFMRWKGVDYVYWAMEDSRLLSDPVPVDKVYPWCFGERPVVIGMGQMEPHRTYQMSMVESVQPLQQEINDSANLRLDRQKQIISPPTMVRRGKNVDLAQVQRKGPNGIILVNDMADVGPMDLPDAEGSLFTEAQGMNSDIDDLSGVMDGSSQSARGAQNDTLGGLHLLAETGNQVADFDMSVWVETWAQPVITQVLRLEEHYETDERVLAICGARAQLWQKYGVDEITDQFLKEQTTIRVNLGIGASSHPMQKVAMFAQCWDVAAKALAPFVSVGKVEAMPDPETIVNTIFSSGGFRDGGARFFAKLGIAPPPDPSQQPPDPKLIDAQTKQQQAQIAQEKNQATAMIAARKMQNDRDIEHTKALASLHGDAADLQIERMKATAQITAAREQRHSDHAISAADHAHRHLTSAMSPFLEALKAHLLPPTGPIDPRKATGPMMSPVPKPSAQAQPAMFANLEAKPK